MATGSVNKLPHLRMFWFLMMPTCEDTWLSVVIALFTSLGPCTVPGTVSTVILP
ncbi:Uncharacterised protein [Mycobacteroides abscessus subsp. abscessus]|nr:Uncharacterised protein [Mycobacteroides abscessus subsp. abscessus]